MSLAAKYSAYVRRLEWPVQSDIELPNGVCTTSDGCTCSESGEGLPLALSAKCRMYQDGVSWPTRSDFEARPNGAGLPMSMSAKRSAYLSGVQWPKLSDIEAATYFPCVDPYQSLDTYSCDDMGQDSNGSELSGIANSRPIPVEHVVVDDMEGVAELDIFKSFVQPSRHFNASCDDDRDFSQEEESIRKFSNLKLRRGAVALGVRELQKTNKQSFEPTRMQSMHQYVCQQQSRTFARSQLQEPVFSKQQRSALRKWLLHRNRGGEPIIFGCDMGDE